MSIDSIVCARCGRALAGKTAYVLDALPRHLGCVLMYRPLLRRSTLTGLVVGTILTAINQGTLILAGNFPPELAWKIPLTYCVPFCVSTWGALSNSRRRILGN